MSQTNVRQNWTEVPHCAIMSILTAFGVSLKQGLGKYDFYDNCLK